MTHEPDTEPEDAEVVDGLPVLAGAPSAAPAASSTLPATVAPRRAAAMTAGGFLAGAATVAMVHRHRSKGLARRLRRPTSKPRTAIGEVLASNSFLVDVHLLRRD